MSFRLETYFKNLLKLGILRTLNALIKLQFPLVVFKKYSTYPSEITILTYDALGLIYYAWKRNGDINSVNDFLFKRKIKGKIGEFSFRDKKVNQDLNIYKVEKNKFTKF